MSTGRSCLEFCACVLSGLLTGALLLITWHGIEPTLKLADALLRYLYAGTVEL